MKRRAVCFLLCLCFCFCSVSLKSSAVDEYDEYYLYEELPEPYYDENGDYIYPLDWSMVPSFWDMGYINFSWFNPDSLPWDTFPSYIQEIVYMSLSGMSSDTKEGYKVPFVMVKVWSSSVIVYVGLNVGLGGYVSSNTSNPTFYRICSINSSYFEPGVHSVLYAASFDTNLNLVSSWEALEPLEWGSEGRVYYYGGSQLSSSHKCDIYTYGSNGVAFTPRTGYKIFNAFGNSTGVAFQIYNIGSGTSSLSTNGFYYNGDFNSQFPNVGVRYFVPLTPEQIKSKVDEERNELIEEGNETSKGIWETLKGIPEAIGEKIKGLFVPSEGFFDTYQQEFQTYFKDRFGILYEIPELVINLLQKFVTFNPKDSDYSITFPEVKLPVLEDGEWREEKFIEAQEFSFDFINEAPFSLLYDAYVAFIWLVYILLLVNLIKYKANSVFKGG